MICPQKFKTLYKLLGTFLFIRPVRFLVTRLFLYVRAALLGYESYGV